MDNKKKLRALCVLQLLYQLTDEETPLSTTEISSLLKEKYGIDAYRTTVAADIEQLKDFGLDVYTIKTTQNRYFLNSRMFEMPELKLLIDAVESSKFITAKKSKDLVEKITNLASINQAKELKRHLCTENRIKPGNEHIYYIVDTLNTAINEQRKVSFQYFQYNVKKEKKLKHDGEIYTFSPYTLVWNGDYYYVIGYSDKHGGIGSFRVDRIYTSPKILKVAAVPKPDDFSEADYIRKVFHMFNGDLQTVELVCENSTMDTIIDYFGEDVRTYAYDLYSFKIEAEISVSQVFYSWVFGFGGKVKILAPDNVKEQYKEMLSKANNGI